MTTIAFDQFSIAADSRANNGGIVEQGAFKKLIAKDGRVFALAGVALMLPAFIKWYENGADPEKVPTFPGRKEDWFGELVVWSSGKFIHYSPLPDFPYGGEVSTPFAIGSGAKFAMGAMLAGKSPREAVEIAAKLDEATGGPIQEIDLCSFMRSHAAQPLRRMSGV
jgi:hypothetical protein